MKKLLILSLLIPFILLLLSTKVVAFKNDQIHVPIVQSYPLEPISSSPNNLPFKLGDFIHDQPAGIIAEVGGLGPNCDTVYVHETKGKEVGGSYNTFAVMRNLLLKEFQKYNFPASNIEFDYLLEHRMVEVKSKICIIDNPSTRPVITGKIKGKTYVRFKWILKDQVKNIKLFELETEGSFVTDQYLQTTPEKGSSEFLANAIKNAIRNLMADKDFRLIITTLNNVEEPSTDNNYVSRDDLNDNKLLPAASGSGFAISKDGYILTNNHVINGCQALNIHTNGKLVSARLIASDPINDLAIIKGDFKPQTIFYLDPSTPKLLDDIYVAGYPFGYDINNSIKITKGIVSSLSGLGNNFSNMQIDAAIQPGNSGGPVLYKKGKVIGVVVANLYMETVYKDYGVIPENTNFAIKSSVAKNFAESNDIRLIKKNLYRNRSLGKYISNGTYYLSCMMTMTRIKEMQTKKVFFQNITK